MVKPYWVVTQSHGAVPKVTAALAGGTHESESHASRQAQKVTTPEAKPNGHTTFTMVSKVVQCGGNHVHSVANGKSMTEEQFAHKFGMQNTLGTLLSGCARHWQNVAETLCTLCQGRDWKAFWAWFLNAKHKAHTIFKIVNELCATVGKHNASNAFRHRCFACKAPSAHYLEDVLRCSMHWFCTNMSWKHSMKNLCIAGHCAKSLSESSRNTMFAEAGRTNPHCAKGMIEKHSGHDFGMQNARRTLFSR